MDDIQCPRCRLINPPSVERCDCGFNLATGNTPVYRQGSTVMAEDCGTLPPRCVKCNQAAHGAPINITFVDSAVGTPSSVRSAASHFASRRTARVNFYLCRQHRRHRSMMRWIGVLLLMLGLTMGGYAFTAYSQPPDALFYSAMALILGGLFSLVHYQQRFLKARVLGQQVWISGAGPEFLDSLSTA